jgi:uncharacterized Ntn-hydrolase superfamily protein
VLGGTFTILARDPGSGQLGVAVQSRFLAVGAAVPAARAGVGAVATQAWSNPTYGTRALASLEAGLSPDAVVRRLIEDDEERNVRQVGVLDASGRAAVHTGRNCFPWAGSVQDDDLACLGNVLAGPQVVEAMADAFRKTAGEFDARLLAALYAGQAAGGDWRGREAAAMLVVRPRADYKRLSDTYINLRVDHHAEPIEELGRLLDLHRQRFRWHEQRELAIAGDVAMILRVALSVLGYLPGPVTAPWDAAATSALRRFCSDEGANTEGVEAGRISVQAFEAVRRRYALA